MLAHFFLNSDHEQLLKMQLAFVTGMLGGPVAYSGKSLSQAHDGLTIRAPHFLRRQKLLQETMAEAGLSAAVIQSWLAQEERLKPLIMNDQQTCIQQPKPPKPNS